MSSAVQNLVKCSMFSFDIMYYLYTLCGGRIRIFKSGFLFMSGSGLKQINSKLVTHWSFE